ncbi:hypothetical protein [Clostridium massiliamazoniense]|uniref:hypothetical protein n=1 Tax=Clostridium massiliamazoniense TaxID=1347366 RepID=UPI000A681A73|nr:hypothetical protein [Clostridium massiliamazoniense]
MHTKEYKIVSITSKMTELLLLNDVNIERLYNLLESEDENTKMLIDVLFFTLNT